MDKPELTNLQRSQIDAMVSMAGELLFEVEAGTGNKWTRNVLKELAHHLGRLYGETIRTCRGYDGLKEEVTTTFMCGMALEPNFGREEAPEYKKLERLPAHKRKALLEGSWGRLADPGAEAREDELPAKHYCCQCSSTPCKMPKVHGPKTPGQLLYEGQPWPQPRRPWAQLPDVIRLAFEQEVMTRAEAAKSPGQLLYEKQVEECGEDCPSWKLLDCITMENLERDAKAEGAAKACSKCTGTGNMSLLDEYEKCDAC